MSSETPLSSAETRVEHQEAQEDNAVPYVVLDGEGYGMHIAVYDVPAGLEEQLASRTINARGAQFVFEVDQIGKIRTTFYSNDPHTTANAIGVRLALRIEDPSPPGVEECLIM